MRRIVVLYALWGVSVAVRNCHTILCEFRVVLIYRFVPAALCRKIAGDVIWCACTWRPSEKISGQEEQAKGE